MQDGPLEILLLLLKSKNFNITKLAEKFACSKRTIRRYIRLLKDKGFLIKHENGFLIIKEADVLSGIIRRQDLSELRESVKANAKLKHFRIQELLELLERLESLTKEN